MDYNEFINVIDLVVTESAKRIVKQNLIAPPGRRPDQKYITMSSYCNGLSENDKAHVDMIIKESVEVSVFLFLCVLDGVTAIEDSTDKGELKLYYERHGEVTLINDPKVDLHDLMKRD